MMRHRESALASYSVMDSNVSCITPPQRTSINAGSDLGAPRLRVGERGAPGCSRGGKRLSGTVHDQLLSNPGSYRLNGCSAQRQELCDAGVVVDEIDNFQSSNQSSRNMDALSLLIDSVGIRMSDVSDNASESPCKTMLSEFLGEECSDDERVGRQGGAATTGGVAAGRGGPLCTPSRSGLRSSDWDSRESPPWTRVGRASTIRCIATASSPSTASGLLLLRSGGAPRPRSPPAVAHNMRHDELYRMELHSGVATGTPPSAGAEVQGHLLQSSGLPSSATFRAGAGSAALAPPQLNGSSLVLSPGPPQEAQGGASRGLSFQRGKVVGSGGFGVVYQAVLSDGVLVAVKEIKLEANSKAIDHEVNILSALPPHPNCVRYLGSRHSRHHYYIIMEYISGGSIQSLRTSVGQFKESVMRQYAYMVLHGLRHLHQHGIIHRDIKGANVLVDERGVAKIVDFGCCKDLNQGGSTVGGGTPLWMAPEVCRGAPASEKSDVWAIGCLCLEMTNESGQPWSFEKTISLQGIVYAIACATQPPAIPGHLSPLAQNFLQCCLSLDAGERPTVNDLLEHPFFTVAIGSDDCSSEWDDDEPLVSREPSLNSTDLPEIVSDRHAQGAACGLAARGRASASNAGLTEYYPALQDVHSVNAGFRLDPVGFDDEPAGVPCPVGFAAVTHRGGSGSVALGPATVRPVLGDMTTPRHCHVDSGSPSSAEYLASVDMSIPDVGDTIVDLEDDGEHMWNSDGRVRTMSTVPSDAHALLPTPKDQRTRRGHSSAAEGRSPPVDLLRDFVASSPRPLLAMAGSSAAPSNPPVLSPRWVIVSSPNQSARSAGHVDPTSRPYSHGPRGRAESFPVVDLWPASAQNSTPRDRGWDFRSVSGGSSATGISGAGGSYTGDNLDMTPLVWESRGSDSVVGGSKLFNVEDISNQFTPQTSSSSGKGLLRKRSSSNVFLRKLFSKSGL